MGVRGTLVLALLVACGAAYLWLEGPPPEARPQDELFSGGTGAEPTQPIRPLLEFAPEEITRITLTRDGKSLVAQLENGTWPQTTPPDVIADFLHNLTGLAELMRIEAGTDELHHYGLEPPQAEIELTRRDGVPLVLLLGEHNPAATGAYVRIGRDGPVVLAGALVVWEFDKAFKALGGS
ncbi:MAG TPA: DUF4340 domain-containing protein [Candidatus Kryptonia bacterium]|nr:DUF4340 domain-containing protein [Candidatus Kryptonia bacterium]